jgi:hypothetical protein
MVPMGGALMAAGDLWEGGWAPTARALVVSGAVTVGLLVGAARDLEQHIPYEPAHRVRPIHAIGDGLAALAVWWTLVAGPVLWGWAGNPAMTDVLAPERGLLAGSALLGTLAVLRWLRHVDPSTAPPWGRPGWRAIAAGLGCGIASALPAPSFAHPWVGAGMERLALGLDPPWLVLVPVVLAQEAWFRGWMQTRAGWVPTALAWALVVCPGDPLVGVVTGLLLGLAGRDGLSSALTARGLGLSTAYLFGALTA